MCTWIDSIQTQPERWMACCASSLPDYFLIFVQKQMVIVIYGSYYQFIVENTVSLRSWRWAWWVMYFLDNQLRKPCLELWASESLCITAGDVLNSSCSLGVMDLLSLYIYLIRYAKCVIILHIWLQWVSQGSALLPDSSKKTSLSQMLGGFMDGWSSGSSLHFHSHL